MPRRDDDRWLCRCDCGRELVVHGDDLRSGRVASCGLCGDGRRVGGASPGAGTAAVTRGRGAATGGDGGVCWWPQGGAVGDVAEAAAPCDASAGGGDGGGGGGE